MRTKYLFLPIVIAISILFSCVGDLDVRPLNEDTMTKEEAYSKPGAYLQALLKLYAVWAIPGQDGDGNTDVSGTDPGNGQLLRSYFNLQVNSTDESKCAWSSDAWVVDINNMTWSNVKNEALESAYQFCMYIVALSNEYLGQLPNAPADVDAVLFRAEARFCRALAYYTLMDLYGRPPFITEENYSLNPEQLSREALFNWIEGELKDIEADLPNARAGEYGRADKGVLNALLARMYLNAEVYTGKQRYTDCITACNKVIAGGYELANVYADLFKADNGENPDTRKEIIHAIVYAGENTKTYGGTKVLIAGSRGQDGTKAESGLADAWGGYRSTQNLVNLFEFSASGDARTPDNIRDIRGIFYKGEGDNERSIEIKTNPLETFLTEGWSVYKYSNMKSDGTAGSHENYPDTDFPFFRLGDVYLMYAEAVARGGDGGSMSTAVNYVNDLRRRGNASLIDEAWLTANNYRNLLDERGREMYWECTRRTDLIRFGLYTSATYTWPSKGGVITGVGVGNHYNLMPIPLTDLTANVLLKQNDGY